MTYEDIIRRIEDDQDFPGRPERFGQFKELLQIYGLEQGCVLSPRIVLVGGTNGKGSVAKTLETLLLDGASRAVGLFTSPHLMDTTERFRSFGEDISRDEFVRVFRQIEPYKLRFGLSRFETFTLMMYEFFFGGRVRDRVETAVIEVGVGGRLDPTNAVPHSICVITSIGRDHEAVLGSSLSEIAREKFAIVGPGMTLVHGPLPVEARLELNRVCEMPGVRVIEAPIFSSSIDRGAGDPVWVLETPWGGAPLALVGQRAAENTSIALCAFQQLGEPVSARLPALRKVVWPGRMERFKVRGRRVYLSGDHNIDGVKSLAALVEEFEYDRLLLVVGIGANKPAGEMLEQFSRIPRSQIVLTNPPFRPTGAAELAKFAGEAAAVEPDPVRALDLAVERAAPSDLVVVSGSLYLVGSLRRWLTKAMT